MQIMVYKPADAISLIFFKLMFFFDDFQPGNTRYSAGKAKDIFLPARVFDALGEAKFLNSAVKRNEADTETVISMLHALGPDNEAGIVIGFPLIRTKPMIYICNSDGGIRFCGDNACRELREGDTGEEYLEEKEALEFLLQKINAVISECTGNDI